MAVSKLRETFKKRPSRKYKTVYTELLKRFKAAREKGRYVNFGWLWSKARVISREQGGGEIRRHVVVNFLKRFNIRMRAKQRNRKQPKGAYREALIKWHSTTRERLVRTGFEDKYDDKWGRFRPEQRMNVDQSPMPFAMNPKRTYELIEENGRYHKVWIAQPGSGLEKRQCTLQICFNPTGIQPRLAIIFRGKGKRISEEEKSAWHKDVDVYFQDHAWADTEFSVKWAERTLANSVKDKERFVLFCDNLSAQISTPFKEAVSNLGGVCWFGLPNATDLWQPVDAGYAQLLKTFVFQMQNDWLDREDNADLWHGNEAGFSAKDRRILITLWAGEAYQKLISEQYDGFRWRMFEKTGCLITADGSGDDKIKPEGLDDYKVLPPITSLPPSNSLPTPNATGNQLPAEETEQTADKQQEERDEEETTEVEEEELEDLEEDRAIDDEMVGRDVTGLYENGWFKGKIKYFNSSLVRYLVEYEDGSTDLVRIDDFNDIDLKIL